MRTWKVVLAVSLILTANMALTVMDGTQETTVKADLPDDNETLENITVGELKDIFIWFYISYFNSNISDILTTLDTIENGSGDFDSLLNKILENQTAILENESAILENQTRIGEEFNTSFNRLEERIDAAVISINNNTSMILFGKTNITENQTLVKTLDELFNASELNLSVSVDDINLEGLNESTIMGKLSTIQNMIGDYDENSSVYTDMSYVIDALYDRNNNPILKNSEGISSFEIIGNFMVNAFDDIRDNQDEMYNFSINGFNQTMNLVHNESTSTRKKVGNEATNVMQSRGPWAMVAAALLLVIVLYIVLTKKRIIPDFLGMFEQERMQPMPEQPPDQYEQPPQQNMRNLFGGYNTKNGPPPCFRDGTTYNIMENENCAGCPYQKECAQAKLSNDAKTQDELMNNLNQPEQPEDDDITDLDSW